MCVKGCKKKSRFRFSPEFEMRQLFHFPRWFCPCIRRRQPKRRDSFRLFPVLDNPEWRKDSTFSREGKKSWDQRYSITNFASRAADSVPPRRVVWLRAETLYVELDLPSKPTWLVSDFHGDISKGYIFDERTFFVWEKYPIPDAALHKGNILELMVETMAWKAPTICSHNVGGDHD